MCILLQIKHTSRIQLSDLWQEIVSNYMLFTRIKLRIMQCQEFQNYYKLFEFEILYNCTIIIRITNVINKYFKQIQFHNHLLIRKKRNDV